LRAAQPFLGTLGNNAPFIGLLGTVIGIVQAFEKFAKRGLGRQRPGHGRDEERSRHEHPALVREPIRPRLAGAARTCLASQRFVPALDRAGNSAATAIRANLRFSR
jgi:MotA/TolQ/ExbB proton channel family